MPAVDAPRLAFVDVVQAKTVKNRIHLDLVPNDASQDQEVDRILSLGAQIIDDRRQATPGGWVVMADPRATNSASRAAAEPPATDTLQSWATPGMIPTSFAAVHRRATGTAKWPL